MEKSLMKLLLEEETEEDSRFDIYRKVYESRKKNIDVLISNFPDGKFKLFLENIIGQEFDLSSLPVHERDDALKLLNTNVSAISKYIMAIQIETLIKIRDNKVNEDPNYSNIAFEIFLQEKVEKDDPEFVNKYLKAIYKRIKIVEDKLKGTKKKGFLSRLLGSFTDEPEIQEIESDITSIFKKTTIDKAVNSFIKYTVEEIVALTEVLRSFDDKTLKAKEVLDSAEPIPDPDGTSDEEGEEIVDEEGEEIVDTPEKTALEGWYDSLSKTSRKNMGKKRFNSLKNSVATGLEKSVKSMERIVAKSVKQWLDNNEEYLTNNKSFANKSLTSLKSIVPDIVSGIIKKESRGNISEKYVIAHTYKYLENYFDKNRALAESRSFDRLGTLAGLK